MAGSMWNAIGKFGKNVKRYSKASNYADRMIKFGAVGAAIGGATQLAEGGSFWRGAGSGAVTGAAIGAGYTAIKAGRKGFMMDNKSKLIQNRAMLRDAIKEYGGNRGTSKKLSDTVIRPLRQPSTVKDGKVVLGEYILDANKQIQYHRVARNPNKMLGAGVKSLRNLGKGDEIIRDICF